MTSNIEAKTASALAYFSYLILVYSFIQLKLAYEKDIMDFLPIFLSVMLLILNNSVKFFNKVPAILAALLTIVLGYFFAQQIQNFTDLSTLQKIAIPLILGMMAFCIYRFAQLFKFRLFS